MGQKDLAQNEYFKDKRRFADVCNRIHNIKKGRGWYKHV